MLLNVSYDGVEITQKCEERDLISNYSKHDIPTLKKSGL